MYFRVVCTPQVPKVVEKFGTDGSLQNCRFSVLDGVLWQESRICTGTLVNFCRRKLSGETLCKVV